MSVLVFVGGHDGETVASSSGLCALVTSSNQFSSGLADITHAAAHTFDFAYDVYAYFGFNINLKV